MTNMYQCIIHNVRHNSTTYTLFEIQMSLLLDNSSMLTTKIMKSIHFENINCHKENINPFLVAEGYKMLAYWSPLSLWVSLKLLFVWPHVFFIYISRKTITSNEKIYTTLYLDECKPSKMTHAISKLITALNMSYNIIIKSWDVDLYSVPVSDEIFFTKSIRRIAVTKVIVLSHNVCTHLISAILKLKQLQVS